MRLQGVAQHPNQTRPVAANQLNPSLAARVKSRCCAGQRRLESGPDGALRSGSMTPSTASDSPHIQKLRAFVDALVELGAAEIVGTLKVERAAAVTVMLDVANRLCFTYHGQNFYVPAGVAPFRSAKHQEIRRQYGAPAEAADGPRPYSRQRIEELATRFGLTTRSIYSIVGQSPDPGRGSAVVANPKLVHDISGGLN